MSTHILPKFSFEAQATSYIHGAAGDGGADGGEEQARQPRAALWLLAIFNQVNIASMYASFLVGFPADDPLYFSSVPWRLPLLLSMYAYTALVALILSHVDLFLPRVPLAAYRAIWYGGFLAVGGVVVVSTMGALGLTVAGNDVVAACTGFFSALVAGLLVLWAWLVLQYGGATNHEPSGQTV